MEELSPKKRDDNCSQQYSHKKRPEKERKCGNYNLKMLNSMNIY